MVLIRTTIVKYGICEKYEPKKAVKYGGLAMTDTYCSTLQVPAQFGGMKRHMADMRLKYEF